MRSGFGEKNRNEDKISVIYDRKRLIFFKIFSILFFIFYCVFIGFFNYKFLEMNNCQDILFYSYKKILSDCWYYLIFLGSLLFPCVLILSAVIDDGKPFDLFIIYDELKINYFTRRKVKSCKFFEIKELKVITHKHEGWGYNWYEVILELRNGEKWDIKLSKLYKWNEESEQLKLIDVIARKANVEPNFFKTVTYK